MDTQQKTSEQLRIEKEMKREQDWTGTIFLTILYFIFRMF